MSHCMLQSSVLCGANVTKVPALQSDSGAVLSGLTGDNMALAVVQNTLENTRCSTPALVYV